MADKELIRISHIQLTPGNSFKFLAFMEGSESGLMEDWTDIRL